MEAFKQMQDLAMRANEPLHPDLALCVIDMDMFQMVQHPLVHTFYMPGQAAMLNDIYRQKKRAWDGYVAADRWDIIIDVLVEKPHRLDALLQHGHKIRSNKLFWEAVASVWTSMEYFHDQLEAWDEVFATVRTGRLSMMDEDEQAKLAAMDDEIEVFRGGDDTGYSWTVNKTIAQWFAARFGAGHDIHTRTIPKSEVIAYLDQRNEEEIIWRPTNS